MTRRSEKISYTLKKALSDILQSKRELEFGVMVSISDVKVTPDLSQAKVFISVLGDSESKNQVKKKLELNVGLIKRSLPKYIQLRKIPAIKFFLDDTLENAERIQRLIDEANSSSKIQ